MLQPELVALLSHWIPFLGLRVGQLSSFQEAAVQVICLTQAIRYLTRDVPMETEENKGEWLEPTLFQFLQPSGAASQETSRCQGQSIFWSLKWLCWCHQVFRQTSEWLTQQQTQRRESTHNSCDSFSEDYLESSGFSLQVFREKGTFCPQWF